MTNEYDISLGTPDDVSGIIALQEPNLPANGGTLSVRQSADWFTNMAAGLLAGIPAAVGVTIASVFIVGLFFVPPYLHTASHTYGEYIDFLMYLISAVLTVSFAHYCRLVLKRLHKRNLTNEILAREFSTEAKTSALCWM